MLFWFYLRFLSKTSRFVEQSHTAWLVLMTPYLPKNTLILTLVCCKVLLFAVYICQTSLVIRYFNFYHHKMFLTLFNFPGYGVFTLQELPKGSFLLEYPGPRITSKDSDRREEQYRLEKKGNFLYFFEDKKEQLWLVRWKMFPIFMFFTVLHLHFFFL